MGLTGDSLMVAFIVSEQLTSLGISFPETVDQILFGFRKLVGDVFDIVLVEMRDIDGGALFQPVAGCWICDRD